jgi:hypothetical protein
MFLGASRSPRSHGSTTGAARCFDWLARLARLHSRGSKSGAGNPPSSCTDFVRRTPSGAFPPAVMQQQGEDEEQQMRSRCVEHRWRYHVARPGARAKPVGQRAWAQWRAGRAARPG